MRSAFAICQLVSVLLVGCSTEWYRQSADDEVYEIVEAKRGSLVTEARRRTAFDAQQRVVALDSVGVDGEFEAFRRTPAPEPARQDLDVEEILAEGLAEEARLETESDAAATDAAAPRDESGASPAAEAMPGVPGDPAAGRPPESDGSAGEDERGSAPPGEAGAAVPVSEEGAAVPEAGAAVPVSEEGAAARAVPTVPSRILSLDDALQLAFANNRDFQSQKESVYLAALSLTLARHRFAPNFFGIITGDWDKGPDGSETGRVTSNFGFTQLFASGARLSLSVFNNFFQFFTGDRREVAETIFDGALTQPLLRGFGKHIVLEPLTQSERDVFYQLRSFERFRRTFAVEVISEYYRVVQDIDTVHNAYLNWQGRVDNRDRSESLAEAERLPQFEVDQARQSELQAHDSWIGAVTQYENSLDRFKITLGIDIESEIALDPAELTKLGADSVRALEFTAYDAISVALAYRLDLMTARDRVEDTDRRVTVAADALRAQLDITGSASLASEGDGAQTPLKFDSRDFAYGVGLDLDLPLDRKAERNDYVRALIDHEREKRDYSLFEDNVALTVRDEYRVLEREIIRFGIQQASLALSEQRVASTTALRDASRATTRDVIDAQDALNDARNDLTAALVNYTIARLLLFRDTGTLQVDEAYQIIEPDMRALVPDGDNNENPGAVQGGGGD